MAQCVTTAGTLLKPALSVGNWDSMEAVHNYYNNYNIIYIIQELMKEGASNCCRTIAWNGI